MTNPVAVLTIPDAVKAFPDLLGTRESEPKKPYTALRVVGNGVSGTAFLVNQTSDDKNIIAKVTDLSSLSDKKKAYARSEVRCLSQCDHFAIIKHIADAETQDHSRLLLLMELADAGDLARQIKHRARENNYFKEHEVAFLFLQIVLAIDYMHKNGILHRDIKSANVFLMSCGIVKIGDLGFSQVYEDTVSTDVGRTFCGTPYYLAPELWRRHRYSKKADVWSLGVLLYEMAALKRPFVANSMIELFDRVVTGEYEPLPRVYSQDMCDLVKSILVFDSDMRPATRDILSMPYMQFVMSQFENTIKSNNHFGEDEKARILDAVKAARLESPAVSSVPLIVSAGGVRTVQRKGIVLKYGSAGWKQRFLLLAGGVLTISLVENTVGETRNLVIRDIQGVFPVNPADLGGRNHCFAIVLANTTGSQVVFQSQSDVEAQQWVDSIEAAVNLDRETQTQSAIIPAHSNSATEPLSFPSQKSSEPGSTSTTTKSESGPGHGAE